MENKASERGRGRCFFEERVLGLGYLLEGKKNGLVDGGGWQLVVVSVGGLVARCWLSVSEGNGVDIFFFGFGFLEGEGRRNDWLEEKVK